MTLAIAIAFNVIFVVALLGGLAYAMSLPRALAPQTTARVSAARRRAPAARQQRRRATRPVAVGS